jgi:hypothetical protein
MTSVFAFMVFFLAEGSAVLMIEPSAVLTTEPIVNRQALNEWTFVERVDFS